MREIKADEFTFTAAESLEASCAELVEAFKEDPLPLEAVETMGRVIRSLAKHAPEAAVRRAVVTLSGPA